jgi:acyl-coenzyme A synthetase/AMP-(fatty) acid ligase
VAIGDAIPGMAIHLVGEDDPSEGEIAITGPQLALGYWRDPELTAGSFRNLPIDGQETRAYFTGDRARRRDGHVFFGGRQDNQVKIRGERVELGDIAASIMRCGWGVSAVALVDGTLHAFIEREGPPSEQSAMVEKLGELLPRHLMPNRYHCLAHLPRNVNDKIDLLQLIDWVRCGKLA